MYIFRAWITTKNGDRIYARDYGKRAFRIWVTKQLNGKCNCAESVSPALLLYIYYNLNASLIAAVVFSFSSIK